MSLLWPFKRHTGHTSPKWRNSFCKHMDLIHAHRIEYWLYWILVERGFWSHGINVTVKGRSFYILYPYIVPPCLQAWNCLSPRLVLYEYLKSLVDICISCKNTSGIYKIHRGVTANFSSLSLVGRNLPLFTLLRHKLILKGTDFEKFLY